MPGRNNTGQLGNELGGNIPLQTPGLGNITVCAASNNSVMAVDESGGVCLGGNTDGELGIGGNSVAFPMYHPTLSDVDSVVAGNFIIFFKSRRYSLDR